MTEEELRQLNKLMPWNSAEDIGIGVYDAAKDIVYLNNADSRDDLLKKTATFNSGFNDHIYIQGRDAIVAKKAPNNSLGREGLVPDAAVNSDGSIKEEFNLHLNPDGTVHDAYRDKYKLADGHLLKIDMPKIELDGATGKIKVSGSQDALNTKAYKEFKDNYQKNFIDKGVEITQDSFQKFQDQLNATYNNIANERLEAQYKEQSLKKAAEQYNIDYQENRKNQAYLSELVNYTPEEFNEFYKNLEKRDDGKAYITLVGKNNKKRFYDIKDLYAYFRKEEDFKLNKIFTGDGDRVLERSKIRSFLGEDNYDAIVKLESKVEKVKDETGREQEVVKNAFIDNAGHLNAIEKTGMNINNFLFGLVDGLSIVGDDIVKSYDPEYVDLMNYAQQYDYNDFDKFLNMGSGITGSIASMFNPFGQVGAVAKISKGVDTAVDGIQATRKAADFWNKAKNLGEGVETVDKINKSLKVAGTAANTWRSQHQIINNGLKLASGVGKGGAVFAKGATKSIIKNSTEEIIAGNIEKTLAGKTTRATSPEEYIAQTTKAVKELNSENLTINKVMNVIDLFMAIKDGNSAMWRSMDNSLTKGIAKFQTGRIDSKIKAYDARMEKYGKNSLVGRTTDFFINKQKLMHMKAANIAYTNGKIGRGEFLNLRAAAHNPRHFAQEAWNMKLVENGAFTKQMELIDAFKNYANRNGIDLKKIDFDEAAKSGKIPRFIPKDLDNAIRLSQDIVMLNSRLANMMANGAAPKDIEAITNTIREKQMAFDGLDDTLKKDATQLGRLASELHELISDAGIKLGIKGSDRWEAARDSGNFMGYSARSFQRTDGEPGVVFSTQDELRNSGFTKAYTGKGAKDGFEEIDTLAAVLLRGQQLGRDYHIKRLEDTAKILHDWDNGVYKSKKTPEVEKQSIKEIWEDAKAKVEAESQPKVEAQAEVKTTEVEVPKNAIIDAVLKDEFTAKKIREDAARFFEGSIYFDGGRMKPEYGGLNPIESTNAAVEFVNKTYANKLQDEGLSVKEAYNVIANDKSYARRVAEDVLFADIQRSLPKSVSNFVNSTDSVRREFKIVESELAQDIRQSLLQAETRLNRLERVDDGIKRGSAKEIKKARTEVEALQKQYAYQRGEEILKAGGNKILTKEYLARHEKMQQLVSDRNAAQRQLYAAKQSLDDLRQIREDFQNSLAETRALASKLSNIKNLTVVNRERIGKVIKRMFDGGEPMPESISSRLLQNGSLKAKTEHWEYIKDFLEADFDDWAKQSLKIMDANVKEAKTIAHKLDKEYKKANWRGKVSNAQKVLDKTERFKVLEGRKTLDELNADREAKKQAVMEARKTDDPKKIQKAQDEWQKSSSELAKAKMKAVEDYDKVEARLAQKSDDILRSFIDEDVITTTSKMIERKLQRERNFYNNLPEEKAQYEHDMADLQKQIDPTSDNGFDTVKINGEDVDINASPYFKELAKVAEPKNIGLVQEALRTVSKMFRWSTTTVNPVSWWSNSWRDAMTSIVSGNSLGTIEAMTKAALNKGYRVSDIETVEGRQNLANMISESFGITDPTATSKIVAHLHQVAGQGTSVNVRGRGAQDLFDVGDGALKTVYNKYAGIGETIEMNSRALNFLNTLEREFQATKNLDEALSMAKFVSNTATTNFSFQFKNISQFGKTASYLNAKFASAASLRLMFLANPATMTANIATFVIAPLTALHLNNNSEENKKAYDKLPPYVKDNNWIIMRDGKLIAAIPLSQELAPFWKSYRQSLLDGDKNYLSAIASFVHPFMGVSVEHWFDYNPSKETLAEHLFKATVKTGAEFTSDVARAGYEILTDTDLFTGEQAYKKLPTVVSDIVIPMFGKDPKTDEGKRMSRGIMRGLEAMFGASLNPVLNAVEGLLGVAPNEREAHSYQDMFMRKSFRTIGKKEAERKGEKNYWDWENQQYGADINMLDKEKKDIKLKIQRLDTEIRAAGDDEEAVKKLKNEREALRNNWGDRVAKILNSWKTKIENGDLPWGDSQQNRLIRLLMLNDEGSVSTGDDVVDAENNEAYLEERNRVVERYYEMGLPASSLKQYLKDTTTQIKGVPYRAAKEAKQIANLEFDGKKLSQIRQEYNDKIREARALKTKAGYKEAERLAKEFTRDYFTPAVVPLVERYGSRVVDSSAVADELESLVLIPNDFTTNKRGRALSSKNRMDYNAAFAQSYIKSLFSGDEYDLKIQHLRSDKMVERAIDQVDKMLKSGDITGAKELGRRTREKIKNGILVGTEADIKKLSI